jgi:CSLREA domain-containing protein
MRSFGFLTLLLVGVGAARAATIPVGSTADDVTVNGNCTLREAVIAANTDTAVDACPAGSGADVITVPAGTYLLTLVGAGEDAAATGDLDVTTDVDLQGAGAASTIIDGNLTDRVFDVDPAASGVTARLAGVTVRNGAQVSEGAGIRNAGTLTIENSAVTDNTATGNSVARGGGIRDSGTLTVVLSTVNDNTAKVITPPGGATAQGGGVYSDGSATIDRTTIDGNTVDSDVAVGASSIAGGGVYSSATLAITASTISHNKANAPAGIQPVSGGVHSQQAQLAMTNATVSANLTIEVGPGSPAGSGAGLGVFGGTAAISNCTFDFNDKIIQPGAILYSDVSLFAATATFRNTIVFNCEDSAGDSAVTANAHNIVFFDTCGFSGSDMVPVDAQLGPLQNNGGPTFTHSVLPTSPAIDGGDPGPPGSGGTTCATSDQRGVSRPQRIRCDVGAVEVDPCPPSPLAGCLTSAKSLLLIKDNGADGASAKDKLIWKFIKGPAAAQSDFGDPTATTNYTLCIYAGTAALSQAFIPGGDICASLPCWKAISTKGYSRTDAAGGAAGVTKALLKGGPKSKIIIKGKGGNLDLTPETLPLAGTITVQLSNNSNSRCWQSTLAAATAKKNSEEMLKVKSP